MPIIGQARCDTALFLPPDSVSKPGRGRPKTCGIKITPEAIQNLPVIEVKLTLYGKEQLARLRAVWCEFYDADKQRWSKARLLLATETELCAEETLHLYARRWGIEPLFHNFLVAQWLCMEFTGLAFRDNFNRKPSIFTFPKQCGNPRFRV